MESEFIAFYENICFQLRNTFQSANTWEIEAAEKTLNSLSEQYPKFLEIMSIIISDKKYEENLRVSATLYFVLNVKSKLKTISSINMEKKLHYLNLILQLLINDFLSLKMKKEFSFLLTEILECDIDEKMMLEILDKANNNLSNNDNLTKFLAGLLCLFSLYSKKTYSNIEILESCFKEETLPKLLQAIEYIILNFKNFHWNIDINNLHEIQPNFESFKKWLEILVLIIEVFELFLKLLKDRKEDYLNLFFENFQIISSFKEIIDLNFSINKTESISLDINNDEILKLLISVKTRSFKCLHILIQNYFNNETKKNKFPYLIQYFCIFLKEKINELTSYFSNSKNISNFLNEKDVLQMNMLLYEYFFFLYLLLQEYKSEQIYQIFSEKKEKLINDILLSLMITTKQEMIEFIENPSEFVNTSTKIAETFNMENLKAIGAIILSSLCDKIDGSLSYLSHALLGNFKIWLSGKESEEKFKNSYFFSNEITFEKKIETTIFIFSVVSHLVIKREDLLIILEDIFNEYFDILINQNESKIIKLRICLFCSYYIFRLFKKNHIDRYLYLFQFVFACLNETPENRAIVLQSIETLAYLIIDNTDYERMKLIINHLLINLNNAGIIVKIEEYNFFEFLANVIKNYNILINKEIFSDLIASVVQRILIENKKLYTNKNILESCLNNVLLICEDEYVLEHFLQEIINNISNLTKLLYNEKTSDSKETVLSIFYRIIEEKKDIPNFIINDFKMIPTIFENNKNSFNNLFQIINQILIYGKKYIETNLNDLETILKMCFFAMENKINDDLNQIKAALIIHILIQNYNQFIQKETLGQIFDKIFSLLSTFSETEYSYLTFFEIIELGLIYFPEVTIQYLFNTQKLKGIFEKISRINYVSCFTYDVQIFILTFCSLVLHCNLETLSSGVLKKIFVLVVETQGFHHLKKKNENPSPFEINFERKRKPEKNEFNAEIEIEDKKEDDTNSLKNNDSLDFSDDFNFKSSHNSFHLQFEEPNKNFEILLRDFMCPIKQENEILHFQETLKRLKIQKPDIYEIFTSELSEQNKSTFLEILSLKKVEVYSSKNRDHQFRKIIKIKTKKKFQNKLPNQNQYNDQEMEYNDSLYIDY